MNPRRVVVTGLGALTLSEMQSLPIGRDSFQKGAAPITCFDASAFKTQLRVN